MLCYVCAFVRACIHTFMCACIRMYVSVKFCVVYVCTCSARTGNHKPYNTLYILGCGCNSSKFRCTQELLLQLRSAMKGGQSLPGKVKCYMVWISCVCTDEYQRMGYKLLVYIR